MKSKSKSAAKAPAKAKRARKGAAATEESAAGAKAGKPATKAKTAGEEAAAKARAVAPPKGKPKSAEKAVKKSPGTRRAKNTAEAFAAEKPAGPSPETQANAEMEAFRVETQIEASDGALEAGPGMEAARNAMEERARGEAVDSAAGTAAEEPVAPEPGREAHEPVNLQRLQKILSQAGIASRRRAEEMIVAGRVMVNGQVVTTLGSKADPARDHIRVDGKLLHGAERHRYFVLNKPRGYVTTVSDPESRPTVMQFFDKLHGRVYPVGRLDYQSEGLLLMTNDGELANLLTKAGSGVEKTYLVKVAGQPSEQDLERLRRGVEIERGSSGSPQTGPRLQGAEKGSGRVQTAPARVRQVRQGENPWFEVVLTEGRNRELRKMFSAVGHFVEKIRRVGYGPLALDIEPGKLRELTPDEVSALRLTAEGKMKPKRMNADRMLPKDAGLAAEMRDDKRGGRRDREFGQREIGGSAKRFPRGFERREGRPPFAPHGRQDERRSDWQKGEFRGRREDFANRGGGRVGFGGRERAFGDAKPRFERPGFGGGPQRERGERGSDGEQKPFRERRERNFDRGNRKPFPAHGERPYWKSGLVAQERRENAPGRSFENGLRKGWGQRPDRRSKNESRGETRGPRQAAPAFRGQARKFGGGKAKPGFGGRRGGFSGSRGEGGRGGSRPGGGFGGRKRG